MTIHDPDLMRRIELERADAARSALEEAALAIESRDGGETYRKAYKTAANVIRWMKAKL